VWAEVQGQRFDVVPGDQQAVTYACMGTLGALDPVSNDGQARLVRYSHYGFNSPIQVAPPLAGAGSASAILADKVSACEITYDPVNKRNGLVAIRLGITRGGESISLYHAIHVNNVP
jgi:MSHA biogenesis protein MshO